MVMLRADLAPSFDALEAMDPSFGELRQQYGLDKIDANNTAPDTVPDDDSYDSDYNPDLETIDIESGRLKSSLTNLTLSAKSIRNIKVGAEKADAEAIRATLESEGYDANAIRAEFNRYKNALPPPDVLLQAQHSIAALRKMLHEGKKELPRFLQYKFEGGIKAHHALCCVLLTDYARAQAKEKEDGIPWQDSPPAATPLVWMLSLGTMLPQINNPVAFIRYQFSLIAHAIPVDAVAPDALRKAIRDKGLPLPNYFLYEEDDKQFPPHIALLVLLQDGEKESRKMHSTLVHLSLCFYATIALCLRVVLEVIGGAGAIWGGAEVFKLRHADNLPLWRAISTFVGVLCLIRFLTLNLPRVEDAGDVLGPAGPWSLRPAVRLRAICDHPFHYFVRAVPTGGASLSHDSYSKKTARLF